MKEQEKIENSNASVSLFEEEVGEPRRRSLAKREVEGLCELTQIIDDSSSKLTFLGQLFALKSPDHDFYMSEEALQGFLMVLDEIKDDLDFVLWKIDELRDKGLIIEKTKESKHAA